jgi:hypothetical protein
MKKTLKYLKYLAGTVIILFCVIVVTAILFPDVQRSTNFDVAMIDDQIYFILEKESKLKEVEVGISTTAAFKKWPESMWRIVNPIDFYPEITLKIRRIKYGEAPEKFDINVSPKKL